MMVSRLAAVLAAGLDLKMPKSCKGGGEGQCEVVCSDWDTMRGMEWEITHSASGHGRLARDGGRRARQAGAWPRDRGAMHGVDVKK